MATTNSASYNSLASIGLTLDRPSRRQRGPSDSSNTTTQDNVSQQSFDGTRGRLNALDVRRSPRRWRPTQTRSAQLFHRRTASSPKSVRISPPCRVCRRSSRLDRGDRPSQSLFSTLSSENADQVVAADADRAGHESGQPAAISCARVHQQRDADRLVAVDAVRARRWAVLPRRRRLIMTINNANLRYLKRRSTRRARRS